MLSSRSVKELDIPPVVERCVIPEIAGLLGSLEVEAAAPGKVVERPLLAGRGSKQRHRREAHVKGGQREVHPTILLEELPAPSAQRHISEAETVVEAEVRGDDRGLLPGIEALVLEYLRVQYVLSVDPELGLGVSS